MSTSDPLALETGWSCEVPLISFEEALELTVFRSGLTRADWLKRLAHQLHRPQLLPLLWLLPRGWKLAPAELPEQLQTLGGLLERSLLTPGLLAALADDLPHLLRAATTAQPTASDLWHGGDGTSLPESLEQLLRRSGPSSPTPGDLPAASITSIKTDAVEDQALSGGLIWRNTGLSHGQSDAERRRNGRAAQVLNRLGANLQDPDDPWRFEQCVSSSRWISSLVETGWQITAQLRCSVASFGLGASLPRAGGGWSQVPIALPIRTGLLGPQGLELQSLLPHSCLELELRREEKLILLQYYQGTEGFCGWEGLNDLDRPWQNNRHNGTVRYLGERWDGERLQAAMALCDVMALVHNSESDAGQLWLGGYGALGFCIDSSAVLQQAIEGRCELFPVLLGGIWRERLLQRCKNLEENTPLPAEHRQALATYRRAIEELPHDGNLFGPEADHARSRLLRCQPNSSPFTLVHQLSDLASQP